MDKDKFQRNLAQRICECRDFRFIQMKGQREMISKKLNFFDEVYQEKAIIKEVASWYQTY